MRIIDCEQGTAGWFEARLGVATASEFHRVLTPTLKPAAGMRTYAYEILAERFLHESASDGGANPWTDRGLVMEGESGDWYTMMTGRPLTKCGFIVTDDGAFGCSPDALVGDDGGLEIKNPSAAVHVGALLGEDAHKHRCQVQGSLWVTGRAWWDLLIYNPELPPILTHNEPDPAWVTAWEAAIGPFLALIEEGDRKLRELGAVPRGSRDPMEDFR